MGCTEECYYKLTVYLLSSIGLWPGQSTILRRFQKVRCSFMVLFGLISQLTPFITTPYSTSFVLHNIPMIIVTMGAVLKYFTFLFQSDDVKKIMELVKHDWSNTNDDEELKIFMHHAVVGKSYTIMFTKVLYPWLILCLLSLYSPRFLDLVAPLNETRSLRFIITFEIFVDQQKYFHILVLVVGVECLTVGTVYLATESLYIMWQQHQTSQFEIYAVGSSRIILGITIHSYRIRKAFLGNRVEMDILDRNAGINKIFAYALDMYDSAILYSMYVRKFWWSYLILLGFGVTSLSVFLYRLSEVLRTLDNLGELLLCAMFIIVEFGYMYYVNNMVQRVIDSYDDVCTATYDTNWYEAPVRAQNMLYLVLLRNMRALNNKMCGMVDLSMESFMMQVKVTLSYFTMILSMQ